MTQLRGGRKINKKRSGLKQSRTFRNVFMGVAPVFCLAFLTAFLAASIFAPINTSNAAETTVTANVTYGAYSLNLTAASAVSLALNASSNGVMTVGESDISISTTAPSGYKLYLGMTGARSDTNSLIHTTNSANVITSSGTIGQAKALTNGTWGYAIPSGSITVANDFDTSYTTQTSGAVNTSKFAAVPAGDDDPVLIDQTQAANPTAKTIPVYYGIRAGFETATGTYSNKVLYTALADAGSSSNLFISPDESPAIGTGQSDTLTVTTTLVTTSEVEVNAYMLTSSQYNNGNPDLANLNSAKMSCTKNTGIDVLQLTCTAPANAVGTYYVYVDVPGYGTHYSKQFNYVYNFYNITNMQQMTANICNDTKYVTTPKATIFKGTNTNGQTGVITSTSDVDDFKDTGNATNSRPNHPGDPNYVPETTLVDTRQTNINGTNTTVSYRVRKLADGNCWMTENLALNWTTTSYQFTTDTSNVTATRKANVATQATSTNGVPSTTEINAWKEGATAGGNWNRYLSRSNGTHTETNPSQSGAAKTNLTGENQNQGTYYNWYTATLGTGESGSTVGVDSTDDICPKGWYLPRYSGSGSWMTLIRDTYHIIKTQGNQSEPEGNTGANNTLHAFPFSLPYSGYVARESGATVLQATNGGFWSAAPSSTTYSRRLSFHGTVVWPELNDYRTYGFSVRCVARRSS